MDPVTNIDTVEEIVEDLCKMSQFTRKINFSGNAVTLQCQC